MTGCSVAMKFVVDVQLDVPARVRHYSDPAMDEMHERIEFGGRRRTTFRNQTAIVDIYMPTTRQYIQFHCPVLPSSSPLSRAGISSAETEAAS